MNVYYFIFLATYHILGFYGFYQDSMFRTLPEGVSYVKKYIKGASQVIFNTGIVSSFVFLFLEYLINPPITGLIYRLELQKFLISLLIFDFTRYIVHYLFHLDYLYINFHKENHRFTEQPGWLTAYGHPVDWVFRGIFPAALPVYLTGMHHYTTIFWILLITGNSILKTNKNSINHYLYPYRNLSFGLVIDKIFGTY